jgi:hypothetical protein
MLAENGVPNGPKVKQHIDQAAFLKKRQDALAKAQKMALEKV